MMDQALAMPKSRNEQILDLAFGSGLYGPRVTTGYERDGATVAILTFGRPSDRQEMVISKYTPLADIETRIQQKVGHLPLGNVSQKQTA